MSESERERAFIENARRALDESTEGLDGHTVRRLKKARREALDAAGKDNLLSWRRLRLPAFGLATAAAAALVLIALRTPAVRGPGPGVEDVEILASPEMMDLVFDLDFYSWLAEEEGHDG